MLVMSQGNGSNLKYHKHSVVFVDKINPPLTLAGFVETRMWQPVKYLRL